MKVLPEHRALAVAAALSVLVGTIFVVFAGISLASGHGVFSWQIAAMLGGYGLLMGVAGVLLWRRQPLARGPVVALALLNGFSAGQFALNQPIMWALLALSLATVVAAVLPSTTRALRRDVS